MAWQTSIADILNQWAQMGVFSYVLPFLLIFAVVFGIIEKSNILGNNKAVNAIISFAIGLLALQFDFVSTFFAEIFPKFGVGIGVFFVLILLVGLFYNEKKDKTTMYVIGLVIAFAVVIWALSSWQFWADQFGIGWWIRDNFWAIVIGIIVVVAVAVVIGRGGSSSGKKKEEEH